MSYAERADSFDADLAAAAAADDSDSQLIALLGRPQADDRERILITAALGESGTGPDWSAAVRAQFSDAMARLATATKSARPGWRDLVCAAVIALARRDGPAASDIYLTAAASTSADVRHYGLMVLAAEGDERAWDPMLATVSEILRRKRISYGRWYDMLHAVQYLARHAARGTDRAEQLISLLRANWGTLARPPQKLVNRGPYVGVRPCEARGRAAAAELEHLRHGINGREEVDGAPVSGAVFARAPSVREQAVWMQPPCLLVLPRGRRCFDPAIGEANHALRWIIARDVRIVPPAQRHPPL